MRPTLWLGRDALKRQYTWSCNPQGLPKPQGHPYAGGLLPHLLTLACAQRAIGGLNF